MSEQERSRDWLLKRNRDLEAELAVCVRRANVQAELDALRAAKPAQLERLLTALGNQEQMALNVVGVGGLTDSQNEFYKGKAAGIRQALESIRFIYESRSPDGDGPSNDDHTPNASDVTTGAGSEPADSHSTDLDALRAALTAKDQQLQRWYFECKRLADDQQLQRWYFECKRLADDQQLQRWYFECKRLADGLAQQFEERVCDDDGNLYADHVVDATFKLIDEFMEEFVKVRAELVAKDQQLKQALEDFASVCACGCPLSEHDNYGEDGLSCEHDGHECMFTSKAVYALLHTERGKLAAKDQQNEADLAQGRQLFHVLQAQRDQLQDELEVKDQQIAHLQAERDEWRAVIVPAGGAFGPKQGTQLLKAVADHVHALTSDLAEARQQLAALHQELSRQQRVMGDATA